MAISLDSKTHPLAPLCTEWLAKIDIAARQKWEKFGTYAAEAMQFFDGAHDFMWKQGYSQGPGGFLEKGATQLPTFRMTVNRVFESVALFGPALYHQNPNILVSPVRRPDFTPEALGMNPQDVMQMQVYEQLQYDEQVEKARRDVQAGYFSHYSNWLISEGDLKAESRPAITEALVKGLSLHWIEITESKATGLRYPWATHESCDNLIVDPDATVWRDVQWAARKCCHPVNVVERKYGLRKGELKGHLQSANAQASKRGQKEGKENRKGESFDLVEYYEIYSKNGFGDRLKSMGADKLQQKYNFEAFGDYCYIVVAKGVPFPLNMPTWSLAEGEQATIERAQWPVPFWIDEKCGGGWPFSRLFFYDKPNAVWPIALIKSVIGQMRFVNWCMSFLADKTAASCVTYAAAMKSAAQEIQKQLAEQRAGGGSSPFTILELSEVMGVKDVNSLVTFLQTPNFPIDIWKMVAEVNLQIDKALGLSELLYGLSSVQLRSAKEADVKDQNLNIRPDDMASKTEDFLSETAMKEIECAVWSLSGQEVAPVLGKVGAHVWDTQILTEGVEAVPLNFSFRVEAGSARKPNKANKIRALNEFGQFAMATFAEMAAAGNVGPWNAYIADWCKANDLDPSQYLLQPPDPENQPPAPEEIEARVKELELQMKQAEMAMDMQFSAQKHRQEMKQDAETHRVELQQTKEKAKTDIAIGRQRLNLQKQQAKVKAKATSNGRK